ncbi:hypothetical protein [Alteromonas sp. 14N.309.X.WAT.G.H12]|uniref:hypothetical protein n=1 Tax=Alteromonas sp. 14N.309.X.WAT.G.H12 TaxID=3120824 RepID=UPI002FD6655B
MNASIAKPKLYIALSFFVGGLIIMVFHTASSSMILTSLVGVVYFSLLLILYCYFVFKRPL